MVRERKALCSYHVHHGVVVGLAIEFLLAFFAESDHPFLDSENGEVFPHIDPISRKPASAFLADDDVARDDTSTSENFYASSFRL